MNNKNIKLKINSKGFTLVETLVAVSILSVSILATFTAVQSSLQSSTTAKDQTTAFYMAQEAMEFIKNIRDENALNSIDNPGSTHWLQGLSEVTTDPCWYGGNGEAQKICRIDSVAESVFTCGVAVGSCENLRQNLDSASPDYKLFGHNGAWNLTNFKREIQFTRNSDDDVLVTIRMSWVSRNIPKSFQVTQLLMNRQ